MAAAVGVVDDDDEAVAMPACNSVGVNAAPVDDDDEDEPAALVKCASDDGSRIDIPAAVGELAANAEDADEANDAVGEPAPPMLAAAAAAAVLSASESADVDEAEDEDEEA